MSLLVLVFLCIPAISRLHTRLLQNPPFRLSKNIERPLEKQTLAPLAMDRSSVNERPTTSRDTIAPQRTPRPATVFRPAATRLRAPPQP